MRSLLVVLAFIAVELALYAVLPTPSPLQFPCREPLCIVVYLS